MAYGSVNVPSASNMDLEPIKNLVLDSTKLYYSNTKTYHVGDYCYYNDEFYKCVEAITIPEDWNSNHWQKTTITDELTVIRVDTDTALTTAQAAARTAQSAQDSVNDIIENGGGSGGGNVIKITFEQAFVGQQYTVTNGTDETKTGIVPDSRVVNVTVAGCNTTYTISATTEDNNEYSNNITTGAYYGQYTVSLSVFTATINVTAVAGATVTATDGTFSYNAIAQSNGVASVAVKKTGNYTVSATLSDRTSTTANVNVTTNGGTYNATVKLIITTVPSQADAPTYTGNAQSPSWNNHNSTELTLGGVTSGTDAASYTATFTPKTGYQWSDGTTTAKNVTWSISKAAGSLSLNKSSLSLTGSSPTGTITVTRAGDGTISAVSSNTAVATVSVSGTTVTVTGASDGSATITVSVAAGTNHNAPSNATCSVTASDMRPTASTTAKSGVNYTNGISSLTQAKLKEYAAAISDNSAITNTTSTVYIDKGSEHYKLSVGDSVTINYGSEARVMKIMGFNHYALNNSSYYGRTTATGKAGILLGAEDCLNTTQQMNTSNINVGGWQSAALRTKLRGDIKNSLPTAWQNIIAPVKRRVSAGNASSTVNDITDETLFLPTEVEVFGTTTYSVANEGSQYAYYKAGNSKVKKVNGAATYWWECSPYASDTGTFCCVRHGGNAGGSDAAASYGVAPCFCV